MIVYVLLAIVLLVVWHLTVPFMQVYTFYRDLKARGLSDHEVAEICRDQSRRYFQLGQDMTKGCGKQCHDLFCEGVGQEHYCHVVDCEERS